jgi:hypothetical protein
MELPLKDKMGQPIEPGAIIVYGHALGRCAALRIGKVVRVGIKQNAYRKDEARITVQGVDDDWDGFYDDDPEWAKKHPITLTARKGTLMFANRTIVLNPAMVPQKYLDLLADVPVETK